MSIGQHHERLMRKCFELAIKAREKGNHPFGALLAQGDLIMLEAENRVSSDRDVTSHAEQILVSRASRSFGPEKIAKLTLYTSSEPCAMCSGAIYWLGIRTVVYGCPAEVLGEMAGGSFVVPCRHIFQYGKSNITVIGPVLEKDAVAVHAGFW